MRIEVLNELRNKSLVTDDQYTALEPIVSNKIFSVYNELRTLLYLGVLLFTTGVGILIYLNIGDLGHILSICALSLLTIGCFYFAFRKAPPYSNERIKPPTGYFDYVVLLGSLLFISVLSYIQFLFGIFDDRLELITLITAVFFFYAAYRFDHLGILSLAVTALASFWSLSISPQKWYSGDFFEVANLHNTAIIFGAALIAIAWLLDRKKIKQHFTFTYLNFGSLIFLVGAVSGMFIREDIYLLYLIILLSGSAAIIYLANKMKSFMLLLYACVFGYIGITYLLTSVLSRVPELWFIYFMASCGGFVYFIVHYRNYFKRSV